MLYSTCTIGTEENQDVIKAFLANHPEFALGALANALPEPWRQDIEEGGMIQLLPHRHGVDGFFLAKLEKH